MHIPPLRPNSFPLISVKQTPGKHAQCFGCEPVYHTERWQTEITAIVLYHVWTFRSGMVEATLEVLLPQFPAIFTVFCRTHHHAQRSPGQQLWSVIIIIIIIVVIFVPCLCTPSVHSVDGLTLRCVRAFVSTHFSCHPAL